MENHKTNQFKLTCPHCGKEAVTIDVYKNGKSAELENMLRLFIDECCCTMPGIQTEASRLYEAFAAWWKGKFTCPMISQKKFGSGLSKRFKSSKSGIYFYAGIGLLSDLES
jgi:hypothetical protein